MDVSIAGLHLSLRFRNVRLRSEGFAAKSIFAMMRPFRASPIEPPSCNFPSWGPHGLVEAEILPELEALGLLLNVPLVPGSSHATVPATTATAALAPT